MNPDWPRWIFRSLTLHLSTTLSYPLFADGTHRTPDPILVEFRHRGPEVVELSGESRLRIVINLLYKISMGEKSFHTPYNVAGDMAAALSDIPLLDDDDNEISCITRFRGPRIIHYGQIEPDISVLQGTVETTHLTYIED